MNLYTFYNHPANLKGHDQKHELIPDEIRRRIRTPMAKPSNFSEQQMDVIKRHANLAYEYAHFVLKDKPFPDGEKAIAKTPSTSSAYASDIIKNRWKPGEAVIAKQPLFAYQYARYTINGRFPEAEETILKSIEVACKYARYVLNKRWPELEKQFNPKIAEENYFVIFEYYMYFKIVPPKDILDILYRTLSGESIKRLLDMIKSVDNKKN